MIALSRLIHLSWNIFRLFPLRFKRLVIHILLPLGFYQQSLQKKLVRSVVDWLIMLLFYLLDLTGIAEFYQILFLLIKWKMKPLNSSEQNVIRAYFGELPFHLVLQDEKAHIGPRQYNFAYVSFFMINSWGKVRRSILIHEMVHVWQYVEFGSVYIYKALRAQHSHSGYDYGGFEELRKAYQNRSHLLDFNFEQQADIIMDGFNYIEQKQHRLTEDRSEVYEYFIRMVNPRFFVEVF